MIAKCRISFDIPDSNGSVIRSGGAIGEQAINDSHTQVVRLPGSRHSRFSQNPKWYCHQIRGWCGMATDRALPISLNHRNMGRLRRCGRRVTATAEHWSRQLILSTPITRTPITAKRVEQKQRPRPGRCSAQCRTFVLIRQSYISFIGTIRCIFDCLVSLDMVYLLAINWRRLSIG